MSVLMETSEKELTNDIENQREENIVERHLDQGTHESVMNTCDERTEEMKEFLTVTKNKNIEIQIEDPTMQEKDCIQHEIENNGLDNSIENQIDIGSTNQLDGAEVVENIHAAERNTMIELCQNRTSTLPSNIKMSRFNPAAKPFMPSNKNFFCPATTCCSSSEGTPEAVKKELLEQSLTQFKERLAIQPRHTEKPIYQEQKTILELHKEGGQESHNFSSNNKSGFEKMHSGKETRIDLENILCQHNTSTTGFTSDVEDTSRDTMDCPNQLDEVPTTPEYHNGSPGESFFNLSDNMKSPSEEKVRPKVKPKKESPEEIKRKESIVEEFRKRYKEGEELQIDEDITASYKRALTMDSLQFPPINSRMKYLLREIGHDKFIENQAWLDPAEEHNRSTESTSMPRIPTATTPASQDEMCKKLVGNLFSQHEVMTINMNAVSVPVQAPHKDGTVVTNASAHIVPCALPLPFGMPMVHSDSQDHLVDVIPEANNDQMMIYKESRPSIPTEDQMFKSGEDYTNLLNKDLSGPKHVDTMHCARKTQPIKVMNSRQTAMPSHISPANINQGIRPMMPSSTVIQETDAVKTSTPTKKFIPDISSSILSERAKPFIPGAEKREEQRFMRGYGSIWETTHEMENLTQYDPYYSPYNRKRIMSECDGFQMRKPLRNSTRRPILIQDPKDIEENTKVKMNLEEPNDVTEGDVSSNPVNVETPKVPKRSFGRGATRETRNMKDVGSGRINFNNSRENPADIFNLYSSGRTITPKENKTYSRTFVNRNVMRQYQNKEDNHRFSGANVSASQSFNLEERNSDLNCCRQKSDCSMDCNNQYNSRSYQRGRYHFARQDYWNHMHNAYPMSFDDYQQAGMGGYGDQVDMAIQHALPHHLTRHMNHQPKTSRGTGRPNQSGRIFNKAISAIHTK